MTVLSSTVISCTAFCDTPALPLKAKHNFTFSYFFCDDVFPLRIKHFTLVGSV